MSRGAGDRIETGIHATGPREFIALGIPSFGMVHLFFCAALYNLRMPMNRIVRQFHIIGKEIGDARNDIVARALAVEEKEPSMRCSHILFLDDDVLAHPDALLKLLQDDRDIVSGLYFAKTSVPTPLVLHGDYDGTARSWTPGEILECTGHGMGLALIKAEVFRKMRDAGGLGLDGLGLDPFGHPAWFKTTRDQLITGQGVPAMFNQTEDMAFLERARALGFQPCVDTSMQTFGWHWAQNEQRAYPLKQWKEYNDHGTITWETDTKPVVWERVA